MKKLQVSPQHLKELADEQQESAAKFEEAIAVVEGTARPLFWDHGLISMQSAHAMVRAEEVRQSACNSIIDVCKDLSTKLGASATTYADTARQTGANLDRQMS